MRVGERRRLMHLRCILRSMARKCRDIMLSFQCFVSIHPVPVIGGFGDGCS